MSDYSYISLDSLKAMLRDETASDDISYRRVLESTSEQIDNWCHRAFRPVLAARVYTPKYASRIDVNDLLSVTALATDENDDLVYEVTWASTDYALEPFNAALDLVPYKRISTKINGRYVFPLSPQSTQITGKWGYLERLETLPSSLSSAITATATTLALNSGNDVDILDTLLIDSEQLYVTGLATDTLTVVRGVNGTTAAAHANAATVKRHRYPGPIVEACAIQATRIFLRPKAPFGVMGAPETGYIRLRSELDPDVKVLLEPYRVLRIGSV